MNEESQPANQAEQGETHRIEFAKQLVGEQYPVFPSDQCIELAFTVLPFTDAVGDLAPLMAPATRRSSRTLNLCPDMCRSAPLNTWGRNMKRPLNGSAISALQIKCARRVAIR